MTLNIIGAAALVAAAFTGTAATAAPVAVKNASFEDQKLPDGGYINGYGPNEWSGGLASPTGPLNPLAATFASIPDGENVLYSATGINGSAYEGLNWQEIASSLEANTRYTLTVDIGRALDVDMAAAAIELTGGPGYNGVPPVVYASRNFAFNSLSAGTFATFSVSFDSLAALSAPLGIRFRTFYDPAQGTGQRVTYFDNVRLDATPIVAAAVPEPAIWGMMILGFALVGNAQRRRRKGQLKFA